MLFRRAAVLLPVVLFAACTFPDYQFDDARFNAQNGNGKAGEGGSDAGGKGGTAGKGGTGTGGKGGTSGSGGAAGDGEGGTAGKGGAGGTSHAGSGGSAGASGSPAGAGGGGTSAGNGGGGSSAGTGGTAGMGGSAAGASGTAGASGSAGKGGSGPAGTCTSASDCKASELCSEFTKIGSESYFKCFPRNPDAGAIKAGGLCTDGGDCESFNCLLTMGATKGICAGTCGTNADCATDAVCFGVNLSQNSSLRICQPKCLSDAGCDPALKTTCAIYEDSVPDPPVVAFACQSTSGVGFGLEPPAGQGCKSGVLIGKLCTKPCDSPSECEAPFPACKSGPIGTASGGTAVIKVCSSQ